MRTYSTRSLLRSSSSSSSPHSSAPSFSGMDMGHGMWTPHVHPQYQYIHQYHHATSSATTTAPAGVSIRGHEDVHNLARDAEAEAEADRAYQNTRRTLLCNAEAALPSSSSYHYPPSSLPRHRRGAGPGSSGGPLLPDRSFNTRGGDGTALRHCKGSRAPLPAPLTKQHQGQAESESEGEGRGMRFVPLSELLPKWRAQHQHQQQHDIKYQQHNQQLRGGFGLGGDDDSW